MKQRYLPGLFLCYSLFAADSPDVRRTNYFKAETDFIAARGAAVLENTADWKRNRDTYRRQLFEMLSLDPLPARGDLKATVTGKVEKEDFVVENLHFQSLPGLYVTANLYLPKQIDKPLPTVLYLTGHGPVIKDGVSYGNKVTYQHHGIWFARHGYACLIVDSLQLGEILGLHHGTYREAMWWWNSRGYTSAGVEAWNCIRALDYLETRPDIDKTRFAATGRSGGGAYSWWVVALDDRIKAAAPVAGITDLHDHVVNGTVEGHCDCMFTVNTYRWDYAQVAALAAPRPLLIVNTDRDPIFPLDGVVRLHSLVRDVYRSYNAATNLGLVISEGGHKDTQDIQVPVMRWFNRYLKGEDPLIERAAVKLLQPEELKVFAKLPADAINTNIHQTFVPLAKVSADVSAGEHAKLLNDLTLKCFAAWPELGPAPVAEVSFAASAGNVTVERLKFYSQPQVELQMYIASVARLPGKITISVVEDMPPDVPALTWLDSLQGKAKLNDSAYVSFSPRGLGADTWTGDAKKQTHIRRRFMLLGQTLDSMRVWDIRQAIRALKLRYPSAELRVESRGTQAVNLLYASLFEPGISGMVLSDLPSSHQQGPDYLNVLRVLDIPVALKIAESRLPVQVQTLPAGK